MFHNINAIMALPIVYNCNSRRRVGRPLPIIRRESRVAERQPEVPESGRYYVHTDAATGKEAKHLPHLS